MPRHGAAPAATGGSRALFSRAFPHTACLVALLDLPRSFTEILEVMFDHQLGVIFFRINPCSHMDRPSDNCFTNCCMSLGKRRRMMSIGNATSHETIILPDVPLAEIEAASDMAVPLLGAPLGADDVAAEAPARAAPAKAAPRVDEDAPQTPASDFTALQLASAEEGEVSDEELVHHMHMLSKVASGEWDNCGEDLSWESLPDKYGSEGITQVYKGGARSNACGKQMQMRLHFVCDGSAGVGQPNTAPDFRRLVQDCEYNFIWRTDVVCTAGLSTGWWFNIFVILAAVAYLGGGIAYKRKKLGVTGLESVPNIDFWRDLPALCSEGFTYFRELTAQLYSHFRGDSAGAAAQGYAEVE